MLDTIDACLCLIFITLLITVYFIRTIKRNGLNLPGPTGKPLVGCLTQLDKVNIHFTMDKWAYEYGEMFSFSLFGELWFVINTSELAREVYLDEATANVTSGRTPTFVSTYIMEDSNISLCSMSDHWKHRRKVAHRLLRAYGEGLRQIEGIVNMMLKKMSKRLSQSVDMTIDPAEIVNDFLLETLEILMTGRNDNRELRNIMKELDDVFNTEVMHPVKNLVLTKLPWIRFLPCEMARNIKIFFDIRQQFFRILDASVSENQDAVGIYKQLLNVLDEEDKANKKNRITMTNVQMIVMDFINAGHLTTRGTLLSIIKILISRRDVQTKIHNEIDRNIGRDRSPCLSDREHCPYTEAAILETLRYITHIPFTPHQAMDDFYFHGVKVPKGCWVYANIWHMHHREEEWTDPFAFRPERFLDENDKLLAATHPIRKRLLSFGVGKRSCIGEVFAKSRIFLFVTTLLQQYTVTTPNNEEVLLFDPKDMIPGIVLTPTEFKCKIVLR